VFGEHLFDDVSRTAPPSEAETGDVRLIFGRNQEQRPEP
jgi:hypothetical protein